MRTRFESISVACCVSAISAAAMAQDPPPEPQCPNKAELTDIGASLTRLDYMAGPDDGSVSDDVLMLDFSITMRNAGAVDAGRSRLRYYVDIRTNGGESVQADDSVMDVYSLRAGGEEETLASIMVGTLGPLLQPAGTVAGSALLRIEADVDNEVSECNEADNRAQVEAPFTTEKVVE